MMARLAEKLRAARLGLPGRYVRSGFGPLLVKRRKDLTFRFSAEGERGYYGPQIRDIIAGLAEDFVFLDIGANQGIFTLLAAGHPRCTGVVAFEPVPSTFAALVENIEVNGLGAKVAAYCGAVSATQGPVLPMSYNPAHSGASQIIEGQSGAGLLAPVLGTAVLDQVFPQAAAGKVVVKIDVEGAEADVLAALEATAFFGRISDFVIEISARMTNWRVNVPAIYGAMERHGFAELTQRPDLSGEFHYDAHFRRG